MSRSPTALVRRIDTRYRTVRSTRSAESMGRRQHGLRTCRQADHRCRMSDIQLMAGAIRAASKKPLRYLREAARLPLQQQAAARMAALPVVELADLAGDVRETAVRLAPSESRHGWSLGAAEQLILQVLIRARGCETAFEIGTFNGGSTRILAETLPEHGKVWTIDLPPNEFDTTQAPAEFSGSQIGVAYRDSAAAHKITQILGDSVLYDFSPYEKSAHLVLVDAGHEYVNGFADTN